MSKGKDFRPRRRGFDDDEMSFEKPGRAARQPFGGGFAPMDMEQPSAPPPGDTVDATVKWFKGDKGFGFVELSNGSGDAFLHIAALQSAGYEAVPPGAKLKVVVTRGMKGLQVARVLEVDTSTATAPPPRGPRSFDSPRPQRQMPDTSNAVDLTGKVKWFDEAKGFGFIAGDDGGKDIFVHISTLRPTGLPGLGEGQAVTMRVIETPKGREAVSINVI